MLTAMLGRKDRVGWKPVGMQMIGMLGLVRTIRRTLGWAVRLGFGRVERLMAPPACPIPVRGVGDAAASRATACGTDAGSLSSGRRGRTVPLPVSLPTAV